LEEGTAAAPRRPVRRQLFDELPVEAAPVGKLIRVALARIPKEGVGRPRSGGLAVAIGMYPGRRRHGHDREHRRPVGAGVGARARDHRRGEPNRDSDVRLDALHLYRLAAIAKMIASQIDC
jgi:hypothetical protein